MSASTDPLATLAAERHFAAHITDAVDANPQLIDWDDDEFRVDNQRLAAAVLNDYTATWEHDGTGLRRLVLRGQWETDPDADLR